MSDRAAELAAEIIGSLVRSVDDPEWESPTAALVRELAALAAEGETAEERIQDAKYVGFNRMQERAEAAEAENKKLSALIVEQEQQYREERKAVEAEITRLSAQVAQYERVVMAARNAEDLWDARMLGAAFVVPDRDDPDPLTQSWYELNDALVALAADTDTE